MHIRNWIMTGLIAFPTLAGATTITVTDTGLADDASSGNCNLYEAILAAEQNVQYDQCPAGGASDTIVLAPNAVYQLDTNYNNIWTGLPNITTDITIEGNGATIQRNPNAAGTFRIFYVESSGSLTIKNAKVRFGALTSFSPEGGAGIYVDAGKLVLDNVVLQTNIANDKSGGSLYLNGQFDALIKDSIITTSKALTGGGIYAETTSSGKLVIQGGQIAWNSANHGAGIYWYTATATLLVQKALFYENTSLFTGGAIGMQGPNVTIEDSRFEGNQAATGGGIRCIANALNIKRSNFNGNKATYYNDASPGRGGAVSAEANCSSVDIGNTTFTKNSAQAAGSVIYGEGKAAGVVRSATIYDNLSGVALSATTTTGSILLANSIIVGNTGGDCSFAGTGLKSGGYNIYPANGGGCPSGTNFYLQGNAADLFASYGWSGLTSAYIPSANSFVLNKISPADCPACLQDDQWGHERGYLKDVGALEAACGDAVIHTSNGEQCDDGNIVGGDGCDPQCKIEICGNGLAQGNEECDDGNVKSSDGCNATCQAESGYSCSGSPSTCQTGCGDGIKAGAEQCDDGNIVDGDGCSSVCASEVCGNGLLQANEDCDDGNANNGDGCNALCKKEICGDGVLQSSLGETCDGSQLGGKNCLSLDMGFDSGTLSCSDQCQFNTSLCKAPPKISCGDGIKNGTEVCDGNQLGSETCLTLNMGFDSGTLSCSAQCLFNTSQCKTTPQPSCGDGIINGTEVCDGSQLGGKTCLGLDMGFDSGTLSCNGQCQFNTSLCQAPPKISCGDGIKNGTEACDGSDLNSKTCLTLGMGFVDGPLACNGDCTYNLKQCATPPKEVCGDGALQAGEQCDTGTLNNSTCMTLGFQGGDLKCTQCMFDTVACQGSAVVEVKNEDAAPGDKTDVKQGVPYIDTITISGAEGGNPLSTQTGSDVGSPARESDSTIAQPGAPASSGGGCSLMR